MKIKIKKLSPAAQRPVYSRQGDAGFDVFSLTDTTIAAGGRVLVSTGIALELPQGYVALVWDRSGMAAKYGIHTLAGVIDCNYRGEIKIVLLNTASLPYNIKKGDRIAQIIIQKYEEVEFEEVAELTESERGESGWLSSGK